MANLLDKANILITPTAYSDGKIHSAKPIQSLSAEKVVNGDFSNDNTDWTLQSGWTINSYKAIVTNAPSLYQRLTQSLNFNLNSNYKISIVCSEYSSGFVYLRKPRGTESDTSLRIDNVGTFVFNLKALTELTEFALAIGALGTDLTIDNISVKEVIDSDLNFTRGSAGTRVNAQGLVENSQGNNIPRINYKNGVGSWLTEPQSTNLVEYSESFDNSYWTKNGATVTSGFSAPSVDSPLGAFKLVFNGSGDELYANIASTSGVSSSVYIKGTLGETIKFGVQGGESIFILSGEWQRIENYLQTSSSRFTINTYSGATAREVYIFASQVEQQSSATSYTKTVGSTQTRLAETASRSGLGDLIDSTQGVLYAEMSALANVNIQRTLSISDGTHNNSVKLGFSKDVTDYKIFANVRLGNVSQVFLTFNFGNVEPTFKKCAIKYKQNDFSLWINGIEVATSTIGSTFTSNTLNYFAFNRGNGGQIFEGNIKSLAIFPILTDEELGCLTTE